MTPAKKQSATNMKVAHKISAFLAALESGEYGGSSVALGRLPGFPNNTRDPDVVDAAVAAIVERLESNHSGPLRQLQLMQRARDLRAEAERLRGGPDEYLTELREFFVAHAADYFAKRGFEYSTLREWRGGLLSAKLLKEAGIE